MVNSQLHVRHGQETSKKRFRCNDTFVKIQIHYELGNASDRSGERNWRSIAEVQCLL